MKIGRGEAVQRHLGQLFDGQTVAGLGEVQLLERFVDRRDEPAFAALVARHGPMVLGVCRKLLADPLDVEDAFQATFLVLVRRAGSIRDRDHLAPWLFGVARKVATRVRADVARRRDREKPGVEEIAARYRADDSSRELGRALIEEIDRLPGPLRDPILLCCVDGLTYDEAADRLRSTAPAIRGRLARARTRLKDRLTRRGFAPTVATLGTLLSAEAASAAVPSRLLLTTIQVAKAGAVPAGVDILAEGVIRTMILTKSKIFAAGLVACGIAGSSMGLVAQDGPAETKTSRPPGESSRLDQVEKKLDRVLEALERKAESGPIAPAQPPLPPRPIEPPAATTKSFIAPRFTPNPFQNGGQNPAKQTLEFRKKEDGEFIIQKDGQTFKFGPGAVTLTGKAVDTGRMETLERKVRELEAKVIKLEKQLAEKPGDAESSADSVIR